MTENNTNKTKQSPDYSLIVNNDDEVWPDLKFRQDGMVEREYCTEKRVCFTYEFYASAITYNEQGFVDAIDSYIENVLSGDARALDVHQVGDTQIQLRDLSGELYIVTVELQFYETLD
jgi:hypothetical protein